MAGKLCETTLGFEPESESVAEARPMVGHTATAAAHSPLYIAGLAIVDSVAAHVADAIPVVLAPAPQMMSTTPNRAEPHQRQQQQRGLANQCRYYTNHGETSMSGKLTVQCTKPDC